MSKKYFQNKIKKLKKKWPKGVRPVFTGNGNLRLIESFEGERLDSVGISTVQDLFDKGHLIEEEQNAMKNKHRRH